MYDDVLVPTDGSEGGTTALEEAIGLARRFDATIHTVYVVEIGVIPADVEAAYVHDALGETGETATETVVERAEEAGVDVAEPAVVSGTPHREILAYAQDNDVDLIVMGTHGRSGIDRYLLGSVTEKVVRTADVPVLTVRVDDEA